MSLMFEAGLQWNEETLTDLLLAGSTPAIQVIPFPKRQEGGAGGTGADWLWWWIGDGGECFGMLVQAKRLKKRSTGAWWIDFFYRDGAQQNALLTTSQKWGVAPVYAVYTGPVDYRSPIECGLSPHPKNLNACSGCHRKSVSILPAILAAPGGIANDPAGLYEKTRALEELLDPVGLDPDPWIIPLVDLSLTAEVAAFVCEPQGGPRAVARLLLDPVLEVRYGQFSLATANDLERRSDDLLYADLLDDQGHFVEPYFENILRGLRRSPPGYVLDAMNGTMSPSQNLTGVAGLVVVHMSPTGDRPYGE